MDSKADDLISVIDLATQNGLRKQTLFKILKRHGIEPSKRRSRSNRGQIVACISPAEAKIVMSVLRAVRPGSETEPTAMPDELAERGVFYLLALEPKADPGRFKVGFAVSLQERLRHLRCSAPFAEVVGTWSCKRLWERTAMDCVANGCDRLHTEVFRAASIETVKERCEQFFGLMPRLVAEVSETPP